MNVADLKHLLENVQTKRINIEDALNELKKLPFKNLGDAKIDHHRYLRTGVPEVIYCEGKSLEQIQKIVNDMHKIYDNILATRASETVYEKIKNVTSKCIYHSSAKLVIINPKETKKVGNITVVSAGTSDTPVAEEAAITAEVLGNQVKRIYDSGVAGIHRLLESCDDLFKANVVIAVAGMEGALASVVGGLVSCPVIGVPTSIGYGTSFGGIAALLSMLNSCASGISVVNIDNGFGAGFQANLINKRIVNNSVNKEK